MKDPLQFFKRIFKVASQIGLRDDPWEKYQKYLKIHPSVIIDESSKLSIFDTPVDPHISLEIDEQSHIFSSFSLLRSEAKIRIGKRCQIGAVHFNCAKYIEVGDDVLMAWGITIIDNDSHALSWKYRQNDVKQCYKDYQKDKNNFIKNKDWSHVPVEPVIIGDRVWIGFNVSILKGVHIGHGSVVGAGSIVAKDIPPRALVAGNPAKIIKKI